MLNRHESQVLREIEEGLYADDPDLAGRMQRRLTRDPLRWMRRGYDAIIGFATTLAVLCLMLGEAVPGLVAAMVAFIVLHRRRHRFPPRPDHWWTRLLQTGARPADTGGTSRKP
jgi:hypothetical protein